MTTRRIVVIGATVAAATIALGGASFVAAAGTSTGIATADSTPTSAPSTSTSSTSAPSTSAAVSAPATAQQLFPGQSTGPAVSRDEAIAIALEHVGGGRVSKVEIEREHGRLEWKVEVVGGGVEHDVRVDAATGTVTRTDRDD